MGEGLVHGGQEKSRVLTQVGGCRRQLWMGQEVVGDARGGLGGGGGGGGGGYL